LDRLSLKYQLAGSAEAEEKGYWRWAIFSTKSKKLCKLVQFMGRFLTQKNAEAVVFRLKERIKTRRRLVPNTP
jgi:hypothetical protein